MFPQSMAQLDGVAPGQPSVFKLVLLGGGSVGKSSLALRFVKDDFKSILPTVGCKWRARGVCPGVGGRGATPPTHVAGARRTRCPEASRSGQGADGAPWAARTGSGSAEAAAQGLWPRVGCVKDWAVEGALRTSQPLTLPVPSVRPPPSAWTQFTSLARVGAAGSAEPPPFRHAT